MFTFISSNLFFNVTNLYNITLIHVLISTIFKTGHLKANAQTWYGVIYEPTDKPLCHDILIHINGNGYNFCVNNQYQIFKDLQPKCFAPSSFCPISLLFTNVLTLQEKEFIERSVQIMCSQPTQWSRLSPTRLVNISRTKMYSNIISLWVKPLIYKPELRLFLTIQTLQFNQRDNYSRINTFFSSRK